MWNADVVNLYFFQHWFHMVPFFHTLFTPFSHDFHTHSPSSVGSGYSLRISIWNFWRYILYCFRPSDLQYSFIFKTSIGKYGSCKVMCIMFRDKLIIGFFKFPFRGGFSLHLHKMVCMARNFTRAVNFQRAYQNSLMLTSIIVLAEWANTQNWGEAR